MVTEGYADGKDIELGDEVDASATAGSTSSASPAPLGGDSSDIYVPLADAADDSPTARAG